MARFTLRGGDICSPHMPLLEPELSDVQPPVTKKIQTGLISLFAVQRCRSRCRLQSQGRQRAIRLRRVASEAQGGFTIVGHRELQLKRMKRLDSPRRRGQVRQKLDSL